MGENVKGALRALILAICASAVSYANQPVANKPVVQHSAQKPSEATTKPQAAVINDPTPNKKPAEAYKSDCSKPNNEGEAVFCVQARQAAAAEALNELTSEQLGVTKEEKLWNKASVIFLLLSFLASAGAAVAAAIAAKHAKDAIRTDRAWVTGKIIEANLSHNSTITDETGTHQYPDVLGFWLIWTNTGRSPAINMELYTNFRVVPFTDESAHQFTPEWGNAPSEGMVLGPGATVGTHRFAIGGDKYNKVVGRTHKIVLYAAVRYLDVIERRTMRYSEACAEVMVIGIGPPDPQTGRRTPTIQSANVGRQNTAT
jgi:hypothetical protein